ncbi:MAG: cysteine hydrolase [Selenomonadaceae bacterium]|nr:cysteine hydrolase [Selenomonadaceae bacterium]
MAKQKNNPNKINPNKLVTVTNPKALIVVDMQNDFVDGSLGTKEAVEMLPRLIEKLERVTAEGKTDIIFTQDTHGENYLDTQEGKLLPIVHCVKKTRGWEIVPELEEFVEKAREVIEKKSFGSTRLPTLLKPYEEVEFVGLCTDICVISNALLVKAFYPEQKVSVDANCCAGSSSENHQKALDVMKNCQCIIKNF